MVSNFLDQASYRKQNRITHSSLLNHTISQGGNPNLLRNVNKTLNSINASGFHATNRTHVVSATRDHSYDRKKVLRKDLKPTLLDFYRKKNDRSQLQITTMSHMPEEESMEIPKSRNYKDVQARLNTIASLNAQLQKRKL